MPVSHAAQCSAPCGPRSLFASLGVAWISFFSVGCSEQRGGAAAHASDVGTRVEVHSAVRTGTLAPRYVGTAIDTGQLTSGFVWEATPPVNFEDARLRRLTSALGPSLLRIGGKACDAAYFCPSEEPCVAPSRYRDSIRDGQLRAGVITKKQIRAIGEFAEAVDAQVMFCTNDGPGPRDPRSGAWLPDNARALIRYARSLPSGGRFQVWELGNEVNVHNFVFKMPGIETPASYAEDVRTFRRLVDEEAPGTRIAGPGSFFLPAGEVAWFTPLLMLQGHVPLDIVSWHLYPTQSERCGGTWLRNLLLRPHLPSVETLFDEGIRARHLGFAEHVAQDAGGRPVWLGETAATQCGGSEGYSDTLLDALWQADWLGAMAEAGSSTLVRQTLIGNDYGLVDGASYEARPSLLALTLFRRTVTEAHLKTIADRSRIKAHGFCAPGGGITFVLANPRPDPLDVELVVDGEPVVDGGQWTIGAATGLSATRATLQGIPVASDGTVPSPPGTPLAFREGRSFARVAPESLVFAVVKARGEATACHP